MNVDTLEDLRFTWYHRIIPLLQEYFYHNSEMLRVAIREKFMPAMTVDRPPDGHFDKDEMT
ncbi:MAG: hypothetical protein ACOYN8_04530 [Pseudanabaena sp.]|jgi:hypothetical protein